MEARSDDGVMIYTITRETSKTRAGNTARLATGWTVYKNIARN